MNPENIAALIRRVEVLEQQMQSLLKPSEPEPKAPCAKTGDELVKELMEKEGKSLLELFPMDEKSTNCPRCDLSFGSLLHPFCQHRHCPAREYGKLHPGSPPPPVNRANVTLTDGSPVVPDHRELKPNGQQKGYVVLSDEERAKGFVRPVRDSYIHQTCGTLTRMGQALAETYARDPHFYSGTFCCGCGKHFPVGEEGEFVWSGTEEKVGT